MDKEIERIMEEIEQSLASDSKREQWALMPIEQASCSHPARGVLNSVSG